MKQTHKPIAITLFILTFLLFSIVPIAFADTALVKSSTVNVRSGAGLEYDVVTQIKKDTEYPVLSTNSSWVQIDLGNGKNGWVADWLIDIISNEPKEVSHTYIDSTVPILNVRSGPSTSFAIVDKLSPGKSYLLLESDGDWGKIQLGDNKTGWVSLQYTASFTETTKELPATQESNTVGSDIQEPSQISTIISVDTDILNLRETPSLDAAILKKLSRGTQAKSLQSEGDWSEVQLDDGTKGWVYRTYIKEVKSASVETAQHVPSITNPTSANAKVKIITNGTNLRKGPSTKENVVQKAQAGDTYPILKTEGEWFLIDIGNGKSAYVAGWVVSAEGVPNIVKNSMSNVLQGKVIVVDAGHGGADHGTTGKGKKTKEKDVNLLIASLLTKKLEASGAKVIMTRSNDTFISLQTRVDVAINNKADAFISIHHNSYKTSSMKGSMTFYYNASRDKSLAQYVQSDLVKYNGLKDLGARKGDYFVIRENTQPAVLIELGFLSNESEEITIRSAKYQENSAEGIFQGIVKYFVNVKK